MSLELIHRVLMARGTLNDTSTLEKDILVALANFTPEGRFTACASLDSISNLTGYDVMLISQCIDGLLERDILLGISDDAGMEVRINPVRLLKFTDYMKMKLGI